jgi:hypothetical protein
MLGDVDGAALVARGDVDAEVFESPQAASAAAPVNKSRKAPRIAHARARGPRW